MASDSAPSPLPRGIVIASQLAWIWGGCGAFLTLVMYTLSFHLPKTAPVTEDLLGAIALVLLYFLTGYLLTTRPRVGRWIAVGLTGVTLLGVAASPSAWALPPLAANLPIFGLVVANWKRLSRVPYGQGGA